MYRCGERWTIRACGILILLALGQSFLAPRVAPYRPGPDERVIYDMTQHSLYCRGTVQRAMIFAPVPWHYMTSDGTDAHIGFVAEYLRGEARQNLLHKLFPAFSTRAEAHTNGAAIPLGVEQILLERPDAVLTWAWFGTDLARLHYPGLVRIINDDRIDTGALFHLLGELTGKQKRVHWLLQRAAWEAVAVTQQVPENVARVRVMTIRNEHFSFWNNNWKTFHAVMRTIGGYNPAEQLRSSNGGLNIETLISLDPAVLFLADSVKNGVTPLDIYRNPALQTVGAVYNKRVYRMPTGASRMSGPVEMPLLLGWMARLLHPELDWHHPLRKAIKATYLEVYGYTMQEEEIDAMLRLGENRMSAHYLDLMAADETLKKIQGEAEP